VHPPGILGVRRKRHGARNLGDRPDLESVRGKLLNCLSARGEAENGVGSYNQDDGEESQSFHAPIDYHCVERDFGQEFRQKKRAAN
jgi:hypothetical protein